MLVSAAEALQAVRSMGGRGVRVRESSIAWAELMDFKRTATDPVPRQVEQGWAEMGIDTFHGRARFVASTTLAVGDDRLVGRRVVIAAGAIPAPLRFPGAELLTTSERFLELDELPARIVFVGGGYVSFEFAHVAARAGAEVTILHRGRRPLEGFDPDLVDVLVTRTQELGVRIETATEVQGVERAGDVLVVRAFTDGRERPFAADMAVHGAGRVPEVDDLGLETAGVERGPRGVVVNEYLQSVSNPDVYAAGDAAASGPPLTPKAAQDAEAVATNLLQGNRQTPNYEGLASVVFTVPPLAAAGLGEAAARARGLRFRAHRQDTSHWFSTRRLGETRSAFKILVDDGSQRLLGAHLFGPHADEVINVFAVAIRLGLRADHLKHVPFAYPTSASDIPYML
jgi:glutathione reductase (NADPH)